MDMFGLVDINIILVAIGLLCVLLLITTLQLPGYQKHITAAAAGILGFGIIFLPTLSGNVLENLLWKERASLEGQFAAVIENRTGILTVDKNGTVFGNGAYD